MTLFGTESEVSGVSGDDEREPIIAAVDVDIGEDGAHGRRAQRRAQRWACSAAGDGTTRTSDREGLPRWGGPRPPRTPGTLINIPCPGSRTS